MLERDVVVLVIVVVPPFTNTGCGVHSNEDDVVLSELLLVKLDDEAGAIPLELLGTTLAVGQSSDRITYGPRSREGRREMCEGVDMFAEDLRSGLPVV